MKLIVIGASGHWDIAKEAADLCPSLEIAAFASGCCEEDVSCLEASLPTAKPYANWQEMIKKEQADMAIVNPWFGYAADITAACLEHGMDVYSEKPLAATHEQLEMLEQAWRRSEHALGGMFNYRFSPWFMAIERAVQDGLIGEVRQIHAQKSYRMGTRPPFYKKRSLMTGLIPWVAIHAIDWACAFTGSCQWVSASHSRFGNRDHGDMEITAAILMGFENGVIGTVTADYLRPAGSARHDDDRLRITGTRGMAEVINGKVYVENENPRFEAELPEPKNALLAFIEAIKAGRSKEFTLSALHATKVSLCARDSADSGGIRIETDNQP
ncbi:MAG: Gfo/Idh/MocA family oxidoreductase [Clostridia bacterium]|nr:Gfo/Idh/MocA family oxidoreductase [Clostridia bacterium]